MYYYNVYYSIKLMLSCVHKIGCYNYDMGPVLRTSSGSQKNFTGESRGGGGGREGRRGEQKVT